MKVSIFKRSIAAVLFLLFTFLACSEAKAFDAVSPTGTILINNGAAATNSLTLTLNLSATDNSGTVAFMRFRFGGNSYGPWQPYAATGTFTVSLPEGSKTIYAQFKDAAGNLSIDSSASDTIILDMTDPTGSVSINNGASVTNNTAVTLNLLANDNSGSVSKMRFSHDNIVWSTWTAFSTTSTWQFPQGEGTKTIYAQFKDAAGNISTTRSDTITFDQTRPTGTVSISNGAASTNATAVTLNLSATDNSGAVSQMKFSSDNVNWSAWSSYASTKAWTLSAGDGLKTVYAQFKDAAGNVSTTVSDTITLDQASPAGYVFINDGAAATNSTGVTLNLSAVDSSGTVSEMMFSNDGNNWSAWFPYAATKAWTLPAGFGMKVVYVIFRDAAGNVSFVLSDYIMLDHTRPVGTISINSGAAATNSFGVTLNLSATDDSGTVSEMRFSSDNVAWTAWYPYAATKAWNLLAVDGTRTVYVQFKDALGNISTSASDTIRLDRTKPAGTISINGGAASTNSTDVYINVAATDNSGTVSQMSLSNDNINWSSWFAYFPTQQWTLAPGDGETAVYVKFKDAAGNVSTVASDTIALDQTAPVGTISINYGVASTNLTAATLTLSATDNSGAVSQMRFSYDNAGWSAWSVYSTSKGATLTAGEGVKTIYAQFQDAVGNVSTSVSDTILLDLTNPAGSVSINTGAASTTSTAVTLNLSATDNSGTVTRMRFRNENTNWSSLTPYAPTHAWTLIAGEGTKTVHVQFQDEAGNVSTAASDTIMLDSTSPTGTISINNGAASTNSTAVTFNLSATDNSGAVSQMRFSYDNAGWSAWSAYASTKPWAISAGEGLRTIYVQFRDAAGNVSASASDTILLDQTLPTGTISINNGAVSTNATAVTLNLSATDNSGAVSQMRFSYDNAGWSGWSAYAATKGATLLPGLGLKTIYAQFKDAAGNVSASSSDTINLVSGANISGRVTTMYGIGISNVIVSINTTPVPTTATTDSNGNYVIYNVPARSYQLTPSVTSANGSLFSPATRNITVGTSNITAQDFRGKVTYSVSGTVHYTGTKTGRVYIGDYAHGTSIPAPGAFTIRGFEPGSSAINAQMDHIGDGRSHATNPSGVVAVTVGSSNVTGVNITLTDPTPSVPVPPQIISVSPSNGAAIIEWKFPSNSAPIESADSFNIYYGTSPSVSPTNGTRVGPVSPWGSTKGYLLRGLTNGSTLYFVVVSNAGINTSVPSNVYGPVTIGPRTGGNTVSGTINASGFTPTGRLVVHLSDTAGARVYSTVITSPAASQPYSITGVPNGSYYLRIAYDMNNNGFFDLGDLSNEAARDDEHMVRVSSNQIKDVTINGDDIFARVITSTYSNQQVHRSIYFTLQHLRRLPVKVTIVSGPGMAGPRDLYKYSPAYYYDSLDSLNPSAVGDTYTIDLTYMDGTTATITRSVTGFVDNILTALTPSGSVPGSTTPTFTWSASPSVLPSTGAYRIWMHKHQNPDEYWYSSPIPSTAVSAQFNFDGFAVMPALTPGSGYTWSVEFEDQYGNSSRSNSLSFTP